MEFFDRTVSLPARQPLSRRGLLTASASAVVAGMSPVARASAEKPSAANVVRGPRMDSRFVFYEDPLEHQRHPESR